MVYVHHPISLFWASSSHPELSHLNFLSLRLCTTEQTTKLHWLNNLSPYLALKLFHSRLQFAQSSYNLVMTNVSGNWKNAVRFLLLLRYYINIISGSLQAHINATWEECEVPAGIEECEVPAGIYYCWCSDTFYGGGGLSPLVPP